MERFVVFFDHDRPLSHFGWDGAFCGAPLNESVEWDEPGLCPRCVRHLPQGSRHLFASPDAHAAACGFGRDFARPLQSGIDLNDPALCDRCLALDLFTVRIGPARISLWKPQSFSLADVAGVPLPTR